MRSLTRVKVIELMLSHTFNYGLKAYGIRNERENISTIYINNNAASSNKYNNIFIYTMSK